MEPLELTKKVLGIFLDVAQIPSAASRLYCAVDSIFQEVMFYALLIYRYSKSSIVTTGQHDGHVTPSNILL